MKLIFISILLFLTLFIFRYTTSQTHFTPGDKVKITTRLTQQPTQSNGQQVISVSSIKVYLPRFPEFDYGDLIEIKGTVTKGEKNLYLDKPEAKIIENMGFFPTLRRKILDIFQKTLPEPESSLISGITLGAKESISPEFFSELKTSGTLHVVVASGMNVTLVADLVMGLLLFFMNRKIAIPLALAGIWSYVLLISPSPPIIRAAVMGSLAFTAQSFGKIYLAWWGLFLAGGMMLIIWPNWITDVGFLLSFGATAGILAFERSLKSYISHKLPYLPRFFKQDFATSIAAQITTTPIILFAFGQFAPWSPVVNAALLWTIAPMTILGFLGGFFGLIFEPLGKIFLLLDYPLAFLFVKVVELF